jgi:hypothetical protein
MPYAGPRWPGPESPIMTGSPASECRDSDGSLSSPPAHTTAHTTFRSRRCQCLYVFSCRVPREPPVPRALPLLLGNILLVRGGSALYWCAAQGCCLSTVCFIIKEIWPLAAANYILTLSLCNNRAEVCGRPGGAGQWGGGEVVKCWGR